MNIIKITKLLSDGQEKTATGRYNLASESQPVWGVSISGGKFHWLYGGTTRGQKMVRELGANEWLVEAYGNDVYDPVSVDDLPDEVCAAVAKYALLGEANDV